MNRLLITGADGFVGRWMVRAARAAGYRVTAAIMPDAMPPAEWDAAENLLPVGIVRADLTKQHEVERLGATVADSAVHLAAIASGAAARENPDAAFLVNDAMTVMFAERFHQTNRSATFLFVSTGEVYGAGHDGPIPEAAARDPRSPYAASKAGAEAALERLRDTLGLRLIVARAFPHSGPGQSTAYVLPALAARLREAKRTGADAVKAGNLSAVRDFLDVRDVVRAYLFLLENGAPGGAYNVASGVGRRLSDCFAALAGIVGVEAHVEQDAALLRPGDIPVLIGDSSKLRTTTGWSPEIPFERTLQDLVNAQAD